MIVGIKDIYLYTGLTPTGGNDSALAIEWLNENNIEYSHLWYGDPAQHAGVFNALNTWGIGTFSDFPFVIYDEMNDDNTTVRRALIGLNAITESNLVELAELSGT
jgi:hypothetical protein